MRDSLLVLAALHAVLLGTLLAVFAWHRDAPTMTLLVVSFAVHWYGIWIGVDAQRRAIRRASERD